MRKARSNLAKAKALVHVTLVTMAVLAVICPVRASLAQGASPRTAPDGGQEAGNNLISAPPNPEWVEYQKNAASGRARLAASDGYGLGLIPPTVDLSHATGQQVASTGRLLLALPTSYDLRTFANKLPPVRDQGACGSCWAFATYGSIESCLRPGETEWNFSEMDMNCFHGFDFTSCYGGNAWMSTAYLARWDGPVDEACCPYTPPNCPSPRPSCDRQKRVQEVIFLPDRSGPLDNDNIKNAVMTYGAVYTGLYYGSAYYNAATYSYYYNGSGGNHAVGVVGWDDNYDRNRFLTVPSGNGAFIIRNSWGSYWGEAGYFYVSYYDTIVGTSNTVFLAAEPTAKYTRNYQYDPYGWVNNVGYTGKTTAWFANMFTAVATEQLAAASFYTPVLSASYELYVYTDPTAGAPRSGTLATSKSGTIASIGYHTIQFTSPVSVTSGHRFSIVVKLTTPGYNYPVAYEYPYPGYCSAASANPGESYLSSKGSSWADLTGSSGFEEANVCLKGLIGDFTPPTVSAVQVQTGLTVDVTFSEAMGAGVTTPGNYTVSGTGKGTLANNPNSVALVSGNKYRLTWTAGEMKNGGDITMTVANVQDLAGNPIGSPNSGTHTGGGIGTAPTVSSVQVQTGLTVDVTFSEAMGTGVTTPGNYTVSGTGKGTLANNPNSVALVSGNNYRLTWTAGEMKNGGDITITVANVQDLAGNLIGSPNSGTHTGGGIGTAPTVDLGAPSASSVCAGGSMSYTVTYTDPNLSAVTLANGHITLNKTGTGDGTVEVSGSGSTSPAERTVTISEISGSGTIGISIAAGTASDLAGNLAPAAGPSATFTVVNPPLITSASSVKVHGSAGPFAINMPLAAPYAIEPRMYAPPFASSIEAVFDQTMDISAAGVTLSSGAIGTLSTKTTIAANDTLVIPITDAPNNNECLSISISGVKDVLTGDCVMDQTILQLVVLKGDIASQWLLVNGDDMSAVKKQLFKSVVADNFTKDVTVDGTIGGNDLSEVKANLFKSASCP